MGEFDYLYKYDIQNKINKIAKKYKNKKIVIYGAGRFAQYLFENYDFSKLNIVAIADNKYNTLANETFCNHKTISPIEINNYNPDLILFLIVDFKLIKRYGKTEIEWILHQNLLDYIKNKIRYGKPKNKTGQKFIFTFWEPKEKMPAYIKLCLNTWKKFLPEYEIIILDYSNLDEWLGYKYYDEYLYKTFSLPMQADAIRIALLNKYGGIWLDADTIITSHNVEKIFAQEAEVTMISTHLAFISAKKNAKVIVNWLKKIKRNIFLHKIYKCFINYSNFIFSIKTMSTLEHCTLFGNSIINCYTTKTSKKHLNCLNRLDIYALPENNFYNELGKENEGVKKYLNFYFENDYSDYVFLNTQGIIMLHNSWTPNEYKKMSKEEFLKQNNTLSKILLKLNGEYND